MSQLLIKLLFSVAIFFAVFLLSTSIISEFSQKIQKTISLNIVSFDQDLNRLFIANYTPRQVLLMVLFGSIIVGMIVWLVTNNLFFSIIAFITVYFLPKIIFAELWKKRIKKFEEMLPSALDQMVGCSQSRSQLTPSDRKCV